LSSFFILDKTPFVSNIRAKVGGRDDGKEEKNNRRRENVCRKGFAGLDELLKAPGAEKFALKRRQKNQIIRFIYSKEFEKTI
jgi:hypothetical protein